MHPFQTILYRITGVLSTEKEAAKTKMPHATEATWGAKYASIMRRNHAAMREMSRN